MGGHGTSGGPWGDRIMSRNHKWIQGLTREVEPTVDPNLVPPGSTGVLAPTSCSERVCVCAQSGRDRELLIVLRDSLAPAPSVSLQYQTSGCHLGVRSVICFGESGFSALRFARHDSRFGAEPGLAQGVTHSGVCFLL